MEKQKLNILVLAGGESAEREVSLDSSRAIAQSLIKSGHRVRVIDTYKGHYLTNASGNLTDDQQHGGEKSPQPGGNVQVHKDLLPTQEIIRVRDDGVDIVFNGLHGGKGENGGVQSVLDMLGIAYTGSPMAASAIAMNKDITKRVMQSLEIPTAQWKTFDALQDNSIDEIVAYVEKGEPSLPVVIKPTDGGSTVGLSLVETGDQIAEAVRTAFDESSSIMVEDYIQGREITISVLAGTALPPVEIKPSHKLYDYACKYTKGKSEYICPADIDDAIVEKLSYDAVRLYNTIGCRGYGRVDFIVGSDGSFVCLELNTLPGMTELSLFPMAARAAGIEFDELLEKLCHLAMEGR
jgi:D-alanine-D-alanine ligase